MKKRLIQPKVTRVLLHLGRRDADNQLRALYRCAGSDEQRVGPGDRYAIGERERRVEREFCNCHDRPADHWHWPQWNDTQHQPDHRFAECDLCAAVDHERDSAPDSVDAGFDEPI